MCDKRGGRREAGIVESKGARRRRAGRRNRVAVDTRKAKLTHISRRYTAKSHARARGALTL